MNQSTLVATLPNLDLLDSQDLLQAEDIFSHLSTYCRLRRLAIKARLAGNIKGAQKVESVLEEIYKKLPAWARW